MSKERDAYRKVAISYCQWFFSLQNGNTQMDVRGLENWKLDASAAVDAEAQRILEEEEK